MTVADMAAQAGIAGIANGGSSAFAKAVGTQGDALLKKLDDVNFMDETALSKGSSSNESVIAQMVDDWNGKTGSQLANNVDEGYNGKGLLDEFTEGAGTSKIPWDSWQNYEKVTTNEQEYAKVGDRLYSKHAVERMQPSGKRFTVGDAIVQAGGVSGRSVAPQFVEDVINSVKPVFQPATGNYIYTSGTVSVVTNQYGYVVTIITVG